MKEFRGKVAVIMGAASGIGRGLAERFAREGMRIVVADIEAGPLEALAASLRASGAEALTVRTDVSKQTDVQALAKRTFEVYGAVHLLCNNAGVGVSRKPIWESTLADWTWVFSVNFWGVVHGIRAFLPRMIEQCFESHVVNTASIAGLVSSPGLGIYQATKFGVVAVSETLALDLAERAPHVRVSVLCPGAVSTRIAESERTRPEGLRNPGTLPGTYEVRARPSRRDTMSPDEVAERVVDAIRQERLYILTHPGRNSAIRRRMEDILTERNPDAGGV